MADSSTTKKLDTPPPDLEPTVRAAGLSPTPFPAADDTGTEPQGLPPLPPIGQLPIVPGYELLKELGRGGMGVVYLARQSRLNRLVAIKMILGAAYAAPEVRQRFLLEGEAIAQLSHPNIVQIYELGTADENPFFAMEYVAGDCLAKRLAGKPIPPEKAASLLAPLADAIQHAHQQGIVHRDLKPANVLLAVSRDAQRSAPGDPLLSESRLTEAVPKITDFGLAKLMDAGPGGGFTQSGDVLGTPSYMAPEQAAGTISRIGPATDIYSLGAILYELLTGRPPFQGLSPLDTALQVMKQEPVPPSRLQPKLPRDLNTICLKCLEKEPTKRYLSAQAVADDLRCFLRGDSIQARPAGPVERGWKWAKRRPTTAALIALATLMFVGLIAAGVWYDRTLRGHNQELTSANAAILKEKNAALAQRAQALDYFRNARTTMDRTVQALLRDPALDRPEMKPLREKLLAPSIAFYQTFATSAKDDPALRPELATAQMTLGDLFFRTGKIEPAEKAFQEAARLAEEVRAAEPTNAKAQTLAGLTQFKLAEFYVWIGKSTPAHAAFKRAIQLQEPLTKATPPDPVALFNLARSYRELGMHLRNGGVLNEAVAVQAKALDLLKEAVRLQPQNQDYVRALALSHNDVGINAIMRNQVAEAKAAFEQTAKLRKKLLDADPSDTRNGYAWAEVLHNMGICATQEGRLADAEKFYLEGNAAAEAIVKAKPSDIEYQTALGLNYQRLGNLYSRMERLDEAEAEYRKALALHEPVRKASPKMAELHVWSMQGFNNLATLYLRTKRPAEALVAIDQAIAAAQAVPKEEARYASVQQNVRRMRHQRAIILGQLGKHEEALAEWDQLMAVAEPALKMVLGVDRAVTLAHLGKAEEAAAAIEAALKVPNLPGGMYYNAACAYSLASKHREGSEQKRFQDRALDLLEKARAAKFFDQQANVDHLQEDPDLKPLHERAEFKKLVAALKN